MYVFCVILVVQTEKAMVKNLLAMQEIWVRSLSQEDPLEKGMATWYSCLENCMDRGTWQATVHKVAESDTTKRLTHTEIEVV